jgi:hypothetical protein
MSYIYYLDNKILAANHYIVVEAECIGILSRGLYGTHTSHTIRNVQETN